MNERRKNYMPVDIDDFRRRYSGQPDSSGLIFRGMMRDGQFAPRGFEFEGGQTVPVVKIAGAMGYIIYTYVSGDGYTEKIDTIELVMPDFKYWTWDSLGRPFDYAGFMELSQREVKSLVRSSGDFWNLGNATRVECLFGRRTYERICPIRTVRMEIPAIQDIAGVNAILIRAWFEDEKKILWHLIWSVPDVLKSVRERYIKQRPEEMKAEETKWYRFLDERLRYREEILRLAWKLPIDWDITSTSTDKHGQYLELTNRKSHVGDQHDQQMPLEVKHFRYDADGVAAFERFLVDAKP